MHAKKFDSCKSIFDPRNPRKNYDPRKKYFDPRNSRNPRKSLAHVTYITTQPTRFSRLLETWLGVEVSQPRLTTTAVR